MKHHIPILLLVKSPMKRKQINSYTYISKKKYQTLAMKQEHHHYHHDIIVC